jgi:fibronectin-binding autotransporter adhesin
MGWLRSCACSAGFGLAVGLLAGCEPGAPALELAVTDGADGADVEPGDGVCEATAGAGDCTFRAAIEEGNAAPGRVRISLAPGAVVTGAEPLPSLRGEVELVGAGATLRGRTLHHGGGALTVRGLTIEGVRRAGGCGGGIESRGGSLVLVDVVVRDNRVTGIRAAGGGICAEGRLSLVGSTVDGNAVRGLWAVGAGVRAGDDLISLGSTLSGNTVAGAVGRRGAAIAGAGGIDVVVSTVSGNRGAPALDAPGATGRILASTVTADTGGPAAVRVGPGVVATGSILDAAGPVCASGGAPGSGGGNVVSDDTCTLSGTGDQEGVDPMLGPLGDNGGRTLTHVPAEGSPAVDAVPVGTPVACDGTVGNDQRSVIRPQGGACDAGAIEVEVTGPPPPVDLIVDDAGDAPDALPGDGVCDAGAGTCTLRAAIDEANAADGPVVVTIAEGIDPVLSIEGGGEDDNATGDLDVRADLTIVGNGATVDGLAGGFYLDRVLHHHEGRLVIEDLTVTGGGIGEVADVGAEGFRGAGILALDELVLRGVTVTRNSADLDIQDVVQAGGGVAVVGATAVFEESTVVRNASGFWNGPGGGIYAVDADVTIVGSTVATNRGYQGYPGGGGIAALRSVVRIVDSEVRGNSMGGQLYLRTGVGIAASDSEIVLERARIVDNTVDRFDPLGLGIYLFRSSLVAVDSVVEGNGSDDLLELPAAGGIFAQQSQVTMTGGAVRGNVVVSGGGHGGRGGGGIWVEDGELRLDGVDVSDNRLAGNGSLGGGVGVRRSVAVINASRIAGNEVRSVRDGQGGGIYADAADVAITGSTVVGNRVEVDGGSGEGGGIHAVNGSTVEVVDSTVADNVVTEPGDDDVTGTAGAGLRLVGSELVLERTAVDGNTVRSGGNAPTLGGGISASGATLQLTDAVVTGNAAINELVATVEGGGLHFDDTVATIRRSTVAGNRAVQAGDEGGGSEGGGVFVFGSSDVSLTASTVSGNTAASGSGVHGTVDVVASTVAGNDGGPSLVGPVSVSGSVLDAPVDSPVCGGPLASGGWNVASDDTCGLDAEGDRQGVDPLLGPLGDNGGPTPTHVPGGGSPAVDAVPTGTPGLCDGSFDTDQRGVTRPQGPACDAGSIEVEPLGP